MRRVCERLLPVHLRHGDGTHHRWVVACEECHTGAAATWKRFDAVGAGKEHVYGPLTNSGYARERAATRALLPVVPAKQATNPQARVKSRLR